MKTKNETKKHAVFSASGSHRWLECPGSIKLCQKAPPSKSSPYAEEGTRAHEMLENLLKNHATPKTDKEMFDYVYNAAELIKDLAKGKELLCETKVDLSFIEKGMFGTVDAAIVDLFGTLTVIDFKYGAGIAVSPEENSQLIYYALGIAHEYNYNFADVRLMIIQPRAPGDTVKEWTTSIENLNLWANKFYNGVELAKSDDPPLKAGSHCRFCPAATICPQIADKAFEKAQIDFSPVKKPTDVPLLPKIDKVEITEEILSCIPLIETWIDAVKERAFDLLKSGVKIPGFKLVEKRATRKWADPKKAERFLVEEYGIDAMTEPELKSPAQIEKAFPMAKDFVKKNAVALSTGLTMVEDSDKRPAVNQIENDFGNYAE